MIATTIGDFVWVRFAKSVNDTSPCRWFKQQRLASGVLHPVDSFDEPMRTLWPYGNWTIEQLLGPSSWTMPVNVEVDRGEQLAAAARNDVWMNWDGRWKRLPIDRVQHMADQLFGEQPEAVNAVDPSAADPGTLATREK